MSSLSNAHRSSISKKGISYTVCGPQTTTKFALICIHGWACQATDYSYLFGELVNQDLNFRAIAVDLPGHGKSSTTNYPVASIAAFAEAVMDLIYELGIGDVVFMGHSMGMRVALEAWRRSLIMTDTPSSSVRVKGIVVLDGSHYKFRSSLFAFDKADARSASLTSDEKKEKMAEAFTRMFSSRTPREFQASTLAHVRAIDAEYNEAMRQSHLDYDHEELDSVLAGIGEAGLPLLNLQATNVDGQNQRVPLKAGERNRWMEFVQENAPQAVQVVVEESNHFPHVDQAGAVAKKVREFVEGLR